ncbi:MAG: lytic transglycosylase domain-containing protein [Chitinophagaceae bacterium]
MKRLLLIFTLIGLMFSQKALAHDIYFCGEPIPTSRDFVANKLMNVIKNQIPNVTLATLRYKAKIYFPYISAWLKYYGIPDDFKYIPIVECGFRNVSSGVGARGFWQLMPEVATELGLIVTPTYDQRDDPGRATIAACKLIRQHYAIIKNSLHISSWILTAACYNFGPGNVLKTVKNQGTDYFKMQLNAETAEYVYRLIAVKELFEHPELYMNGFGVNVFAKSNLSKDTTDADINGLERGDATTKDDDGEFTKMDIGTVKEGTKPVEPKTKSFLVPARIVSDGTPFRDGQIITFQLVSDLKLSSSLQRAGSKIKGQGWLIDDRVYIDLGYGHDVEVMDKMMNKGITPEDAATDDQYVVLKTQIDDN